MKIHSSHCCTVGRWWERFIRVLKDLLNRTVGNAVLAFEELLAVLCDCESVKNNRHLTYVAEDWDYLVPITPVMFLMTISSLNIIDLELSYFVKFHKRVKLRTKLLKDLRGKFRKEYFGLSVQMSEKTTTRTFKDSEVVFVESSNQKIFCFPLAIILEIIPGRDG
ncbi:hypothetical protein AVEN_164440-1 [Araneus ventricosus]|uniref:Uncharacterized protein n=1 Tax=Araneus ventricosus TaxID=182803 RepID=A0A4Y1ZQX9_ARAVE|nr:hypothetical protein AVEN_164440-1 [Araneus ventricosus]